jgi:hypothetical protein
LKGNGIRDYEIRAARPESSPSVRLAQIAGERVPHLQVFQPSLSHDGRWLVLPPERFHNYKSLSSFDH